MLENGFSIMECTIFIFKYIFLFFFFFEKKKNNCSMFSFTDRGIKKDIYTKYMVVWNNVHEKKKFFLYPICKIKCLIRKYQINWFRCHFDQSKKKSTAVLKMSSFLNICAHILLKCLWFALFRMCKPFIVMLKQFFPTHSEHSFDVYKFQRMNEAGTFWNESFIWNSNRWRKAYHFECAFHIESLKMMPPNEFRESEVDNWIKVIENSGKIFEITQVRA